MLPRTVVPALLIALGAAIAAAVSFAQTEPPAGTTRTYMRAKLMHAQELLEAITLEDYEAISSHAGALELLNFDATTQTIQRGGYRDYSNDFLRAATLINKAAEEKNLDGAVLAYFQMTQSCVHCHRHMRIAASP